MASRGPRGDITAASVLRAADRLLVERGRVEGISLRGVAAEVGVAVNALYTYVPSLDAIWHDLADERLGRLQPADLLDRECPHCALLELADRAMTVMGAPGTVSLLRRGPVLGPCSFALSETIMALTEHGSLEPRDAHDLVVGWFYGSSVLDGEGWTSGTDAIRDAETLADFPRIAGRSAPDHRRQAEAILRGIGLSCSAPPMQP
jgi:AcrR family transcriptional regulator